MPTDPERLPRVLSRRRALAMGMSRRAVDHRLRTGAWRIVLPHTYCTSDTFTDRDRLHAALVYAGQGSALSGAAALREAGVRRIAAPQTVLVIVPQTNRCRSAGWVEITRSYRPIRYSQGEGLRRVRVARAAADLALRTPRLDDVRTVIARVIKDGHTTAAELAAELEAGPRRGSAHLRAAIEEAGWGGASAPELKAGRILRRAGITGFQQNVRLELPDGSVREADFYWPHLRAVLEIDSYEWHSEADEWAATWNRHLDLSTFGFSVIHRPPSALRDPARFVREVRAWLAGRDADLRRGLA